MKKIILLLMLCISTSLYAQTNKQYLFVITAPNAQLIKQDAKHYLLQVSAKKSHIGYFTNRPVQESGMMTYGELLKLWTDKSINHNFSKMPPNVAVTMLMNKGHKQSFVATLGQPKLVHGKIIYPMTKTSKKDVLPGQIKNTVVFIDDISWNPGGF